MYVSNHFNHCIKFFAPCGPLIGNKKILILIRDIAPYKKNSLVSRPYLVITEKKMRLRGENISKTFLLKIVYLVKEDTAMSFKYCGLFSLFVHCSRADY
jgi:hypothetical protein